jgi:hypothetical protein
LTITGVYLSTNQTVTVGAGGAGANGGGNDGGNGGSGIVYVRFKV